MEIEEAKERIDVKSVIESYNIHFDKSGKALCPFHSEEEPSLSVKGQRWRCFGCGKSGDVFDFVQIYNGVDFPTAKRTVYEMYGFEYHLTKEENERRSLHEVLYRYCSYWNKKITPEAWKFLFSRGFNVEYVNESLIGFIPAGEQYRASKDELKTLKKLGVIYDNGKHGMSDVERIVFPWWTHGSIVYLSCRRVDGDKLKKYKNLSMPPPIIGSPRGPGLYVTEGVTDTLLAEQHGLKVIGIPGSGLSKVDLPKNVKEVLLIFDNDEAGDKYIERFGVDFFNQGKHVYILRLPRRDTDLSDYLIGGGKIEDLEKVPLVNHFIEKMRADRRAWKPIVYKILKTFDEFDRADAFKLIKGITGYSIDVIRKDYENEVKTIDRQTIFEMEGIKYRQPEGWTVTGPGILLFSSRGVEKVTPQMCIVKNIGQDNLYYKQFVQLYFGVNGKSKEMIYRKGQIANVRELIELANDGLDVHSANVHEFSKFLVDFLNENQELYKEIGEIDVVTQLGWNDDQFILPNVSISREGVSRVYYYENDVKRSGYQKKGTLGGWVDTVRSLKELADPSLIVFLVYTGFAGAILERIGRKSIIIHLFSDTSDGKTISMMFPASIYGYPDTHNGVVIRWENTDNFIIRRLEQQKNIPYFLDELSTKLHKDIQNLIYQFEGGISKGKASKSHAMRTEPQRTWSTAIFSTGEPSILQDRSLGGAMIRTWEFPGMPFREDNTKFVKRIEKRLKENCGHAIEPYIREFLSFEWDKVDTFYESDELTKTEIRIRDQMQAIYIAGVLCEKVFDFGFNTREIITSIFKELIEEKREEGDIVLRFLSFLKDYYAVNKAFFFKVSDGRLHLGDHVPDEGQEKLRAKCLGYIFNRYDLALVKSQFYLVIQEFGVGNTGRMILKKLRDQNKILCTAERHIRIKKSIEGDLVPLIYFPGFLKDIEDIALEEADDDPF